MSLHDQTARAMLSEVAGREAIARVAPLLHGAGIEVIPLKGAWLQTCVYAGRGNRIITDVDLLVREDAFAAGLAVLTAAGFSARDRHTASEQALEHPALALPIDLHCRLFTRGAFSLRTAAIFERSHSDQSAFGVPLRLPDPRDVFAHLVGHFLKSRTPPDDRSRLADFGAIATRFALDATALARHLDAAGMARATRYVLHDLALEGDSFSRELLAALPRDPLGQRLVVAARLLASHRGPHAGPALGAMPGFLLDRSLASGARALLLRVHERATIRPSARRPRPV